MLSALCFCSIIGIHFAIFDYEIKNPIICTENDTAASANDMFDYNNQGALEYLTRIYGDGKVSNIKEKNATLNDDVQNYDQNALNDRYNSEKGYVKDSDKVTGTCAIVACLGLVSYFSTIDGFEISDSFYENYVAIYEACLNKGYATKQNGTSKSKVNNCVTESFSVFNSSRKGNTNWWELHNNIRDAVNSNTPIILDLTNHSTVVVGLTSYEYDCEKEVEVGWWIWDKKKENRTFHETKEFVIVNQGHKFYERSIIPLELVTDTRDGHQVCWAEKK